jgi:hypothetical protein
MKIILIIPCVLLFPGVVDVVKAANNHLRGSNRDLQLFDFAGDGFFGQSDFGGIGGNLGFVKPKPMPTNSNQPSLTFQFPVQPAIPIETPNNIAPVFGNDIFTFPTNLGFLQPTDQADTTDPPTDTTDPADEFECVSDTPFGVDGMFSSPFDGVSTFQSDDQTDPDPPDTSAGCLTVTCGGRGGGVHGGGGGDQTDPDPPDTSAGCPTVASGVLCGTVFRPVNCEGGCRYGNICTALGAGFARNQCI